MPVLKKLTEQEQLDLARAIVALEKANGGLNIDKVNVDETLSKNPGLLSDTQRAAMLKAGRLYEEIWGAK